MSLLLQQKRVLSGDRGSIRTAAGRATPSAQGWKEPVLVDSKVTSPLVEVPVHIIPS